MFAGRPHKAGHICAGAERKMARPGELSGHRLSPWKAGTTMSGQTAARCAKGKDALFG
ncbi:MAG: hypothetical protein ACLUO4_05490 [Christensenellales bacterium]